MDVRNVGNVGNVGNVRNVGNVGNGRGTRGGGGACLDVGERCDELPREAQASEERHQIHDEVVVAQVARVRLESFHVVRPHQIAQLLGVWRLRRITHVRVSSREKGPHETGRRSCRRGTTPLVMG